MLGKSHHLTIQSFFPPIPSPHSKPTSPKTRNLRDGFDDEISPSPVSWHPKSGNTYTYTKIGSIQPGPYRIIFTGRVANYQNVEKNSKLATAAKVLLRMALMDETGVVDIKFWLTRPLAATQRVKLGAIATVHTTFAAALSAVERESSAATCMVSISDTDPSANVEFLEDSDENYADFRIPIGIVDGGQIGGLMPLKVFVESGSDVLGARLLVCVKWKGAKKQIPRKDGAGTVEKRDIGVFDDSMEGNLTLWGSVISSADNWEISKTILLLTAPSLKFWKRDVQLVLNPASLVDINPVHRDAQWLRTYAQKLLHKPDICQPFPYKGFEWEEALYGDRRIKFTFADIDKYSRDINAYAEQLPTRECVGWLNVMIVEMNVATMYRRNMLLCGSCCGFTHFSNSCSANCKKCEEPMASMLPNPNIIGRLSDETGCVTGGNMIWSERAWMSLLGRDVQALSTGTSTEVLRYLDDFYLFARVNLAFGWDLEIGKIAVWDVLPS